jgi:hypothetical protein
VETETSAVFAVFLAAWPGKKGYGWYVLVQRPGDGANQLVEFVALGGVLVAAREARGVVALVPQVLSHVIKHVIKHTT